MALERFPSSCTSYLAPLSAGEGLGVRFTRPSRVHELGNRCNTPICRTMEERYPLLTERIQSSFIDMILIILSMFLFASILDRFENVPDWIRISLFVGLFIIYEPFCMAFGCTAGNYLKRIRVRKYTDTSQRISLLQSIIRYPVKVSLGWISFLTINSNPKRRAVHDLISGSVMVKI